MCSMEIIGISMTRGTCAGNVCLNAGHKGPVRTYTAFSVILADLCGISNNGLKEIGKV